MAYSWWRTLVMVKSATEERLRTEYGDTAVKEGVTIQSLDVRGDRVALGSSHGLLDVWDWRRATKIAGTKVRSMNARALHVVVLFSIC